MPYANQRRQRLRRLRNQLKTIDRLLLVLLTLFTVKQILIAFVSPPFSGHDEVAHFAYIRLVATEHRLPVIPDLAAFRQRVEAGDVDLPGDYLPDDLYQYCAYVLDWDCYEERRWRENPPHIVTIGGKYFPWGWQYAANHPPLYYALLSPVIWLMEDSTPARQQYILRLASIPFGLIVVVLTFLTARTIFPGERFVQHAATSLIAFHPQFSYESAMVNNDVAGIACVALVTLLTVRGLKVGMPSSHQIFIGTAVGVGLLTKSNTMIAVPGVMIAIVSAAGFRNARLWARKLELVSGVAALISFPWTLHLWRTYGNLTGLPDIAALQIRWVYPPGQKPGISDLLFSSDFALMRWRETWGEFGWRRIHLEGNLLAAIAVPTLVALGGLAHYACTTSIKAAKPNGSFSAPERWQRAMLMALFVTCVAAYASVIQFGLTFRLTQARYFFPALPSAAILVAIGWRALLPERAQRYALFALLGGLIVITILIYSQYVLPYWYLEG